MAIRLAVVGVVLVVLGLINLGGLGEFAVPIGAVALIAGGACYLVRNRNAQSRR